MSVVTGSGFEVSAPATAVTGAPVSVTGGALTASAAYLYEVTYVNAYGETTVSAASATITTGATNPAITVTIPVSSNPTVTSRRLYRTTGGGTSYLLAATINDNVTTTYTDKLADGSLGAAPPAINTACSYQVIHGQVQFTKPLQLLPAVAITASTTHTQAGATPTGLVQFVSVTTGNATDVIVLPLLNADLIGLAVFVNNISAVALGVYPSGTNTINAGGAGSSVTHAASIGRWYVASSATNWTQV